MDDVRCLINERVAMAACLYTNYYLVSKDGVLSAIYRLCKLKPNENDGARGLSNTVILYMSLLYVGLRLIFSPNC